MHSQLIAALLCSLGFVSAVCAAGMNPTECVLVLRIQPFILQAILSYTLDIHFNN